MFVLTFGRAVGVCVSTLVALGAMAVPTFAQTVEFRGTGTVIAKSKACTDVGWVIGEKTKPNMRYRPAKVGSNGKPTALAMHYPFWATSFVLEKGNLGSGFKTVVAGATGSGTGVREDGAEVRVTSLSPSKITTKTGTVKIKGEVRGFDVPGCVVTFDAKLKRH
jgi:hypothetical protein